METFSYWGVNPEMSTWALSTSLDLGLIPSRNELARSARYPSRKALEGLILLSPILSSPVESCAPALQISSQLLMPLFITFLLSLCNPSDSISSPCIEVTRAGWRKHSRWIASFAEMSQVTFSYFFVLKTLPPSSFLLFTLFTGVTKFNQFISVQK